MEGARGEGRKIDHSGTEDKDELEVGIGGV